MQNKDCLLREGERLDDLQCQGLQIIQHPGKFCFGMDAVLLSSFAALRNKDTVMDLCTGTGILPILLSAKTKADHIDALEVQKESVEMARRSIILNELSNRITITKVMSKPLLINLAKIATMLSPSIRRI